MKTVLFTCLLTISFFSCDSIKFPTTLPGNSGILTEGEAAQGIKEAPGVERFFDFSIQRRVNADLKAKGWKP